MTQLECSGIIDQGQHKQYRIIELVADAKVRIVVDLDTSYPRMQSRAYAEVWSPNDLRWNQVAYLTSGEWTAETYAKPGGRATADDDIMGAARQLRAQAASILMP